MHHSSTAWYHLLIRFAGKQARKPIQGQLCPQTRRGSFVPSWPPAGKKRSGAEGTLHPYLQCCRSTQGRCCWVQSLFLRGLGGEEPTRSPQQKQSHCLNVRARGPGLTCPAGLHQAEPLSAAVTQQGEGGVVLARCLTWGAHVQQLVPHLQAAAPLQGGMGK